MILPFSTQLNGKPTYFVEKIWAGIENRFAEITKEGKRYLMPEEYFNCLDLGFENMKAFKPKIHTIREDKKERWRPGIKIDFFINCRQKDMFRFAPVLPVVSVQKIEIYYFPLTTIPVRKVPVVKIDGIIIYDAAGINHRQMYELAINDGFESIEDFFNYFNEDFTGKIIHWTGEKY